VVGQTIWEFKQYIPLKAAKFRMQSFEFCVTSTRYFRKFIIHSGISTDLTSSVDPAGSIGTGKTVVKLVEPLSGRGHTL
jgi:hypothetical protein